MNEQQMRLMMQMMQGQRGQQTGAPGQVQQRPPMGGGMMPGGMGQMMRPPMGGGMGMMPGMRPPMMGGGMFGMGGGQQSPFMTNNARIQ